MASRNSVQKGALKIDSGSKPSFIKSRGLHPHSSPRRFSSTSHRTANGDAVPGRVRVAVRLRPQNTDELTTDADFADFVELQSELKRLTLRKNNWSSDTYEFDEVFTEFASQKRVYEVVAKPVVESVLEGYNGTVMAYGQTGTGKTFTLGQLGDEDPSARGIMVRSMEDILAHISRETDSVFISYFQLYMEAVQDLLDPSNDNISIVEDPKSGDVSLPGATHVEIRDQQSFVELLRIGEGHRIAANTKLNTESSRSHAILMVNVKRSVISRKDDLGNEKNNCMQSIKPFMPPVVHKGKLVVVDLAGSERIHKSGSEGHALEEAKFINLSLSSLGKCINALAENSAHVPIRDSKLTRLLRDSFGGTARTSLIVTIGPSPRHRGETTSTIEFGQRAMKVENMLKIKEESDYKSLARKLEIQVDKLIVENERRQKAFDDEKERLNLESENRISDIERNFAGALEKERLKCQMDYMESVKKLDEKWMINENVHQSACGVGDKCSEQLKELLETEIQLRKAAEQNASTLKNQLIEYMEPKAGGITEVSRLRNMVEVEACQKRKLEEELLMLQTQLLELNLEVDEMRKHRGRCGSGSTVTEFDSLTPQVSHSQLHDTFNGQESIAKIFEEVGLKKIISLLASEDPSVRLHAVKVVANLAADETNQEMIVGSGGLNSLLKLLSRDEDESVRRVAAGAIANLAMNEANQELIMSEGGINLLSITAADAEDPRTMRMVAGAIANLCGNEKLQTKLSSDGGIKALIGMVRCRHADVVSQVARGIANFAKCESRSYASQGSRAGKSLLIENGALAWMVQNANNEAASIRRHIELALCHMGQHESNARDMICGGALWELVRVCRECSREDIKNLARKTLYSSPTFQSEMRRLQIHC